MGFRLKGNLEVLTWRQIRDEVAEVNPDFAKIIDEIDPDDQYWLARVTYPYGSLVLERALLMLPNADGDLVPITDSSLPAKIREGLGYNLNSNPVSLVLKNTFEIFLPLENHTIPIQGLIYPGQAFGAWRVLSPKYSQQPAFIWDMTAGARSMFMLPKISEEKKHFKLKKIYNLTINAPKSLMTHWEIFRQIANHPHFDQPWNAQILYFSKSWFDHLEDKKWRDFYYYFHDSIWKNSEFLKNQSFWNMIFSIILKEYQGKPNGYVIDTVKYLMHIGIGAQTAFSPARDNFAAPIAGLQRVYANEYEIRNYPPIIMQPANFDMYSVATDPVYYSLQFPIVFEFGLSSRARNSYISDLHEIKTLLTRYEQEFLSDKLKIRGTPMYDLFGCAKYDFFHNNVELHMGIRNSAEIAKEDENLLTTLDGVIHNDFPDMCSFVKGCIRIARRTSSK